MTTTDWDLLATLIEYPDDLFVDTLVASRTSTRLAPSVATAVRHFEQEIASLSLDDLQELYVAAFDSQPACTLEMGYHLYRDRSERLAFLNELRAAMRERNITLSAELPDHLGAVLRLIGRMAPDRAMTLCTVIAPAVRRVGDSLATARSPYVHLFEAISALVTAPAPEGAIV